MDSNVKMILLMGGIFLIFLMLMGGLIVFALKKGAELNEDTSTLSSSDTAQSFLAFKDIRDSMMDLGNYEYRAIIECQSINYDLKTEQEQGMIDASFQRFLDSLTFPITIHIQTKTIDNTKILQLLEADMVETVKEYEFLYDYANLYFEEMVKINETIGNNKQKKKYIIVPFDDSASLTYSNESEKYEETLKGMYNRCQVVMQGLSAMGVSSRILSSIEIAELIYSSYHRDNYTDISQIISADYMELIVDGKNSIENMDKREKTLWIISECENRLKTELLSLNLNEEEKTRAMNALNGILEIKKEL